MKALLLRDYYINRRMLIILPIAFILFAFQSNDVLFLPIILLMIGAFLILGSLRSTFYQEEASEDVMYYLCTDQGEKQLVASKYLGTLILTIVMALILALSLKFQGDFRFKEILGFASTMVFTMFFIADLIIPITIHFGQGVAKIIYFVFWLGIILGANGLRSLISLENVEKISFISGKPGLAFAILALIILFITLISYSLSLKAMGKKEC